MTNKPPPESFDASQPPRHGLYLASLPGNIEVNLLVWLRCLSPREYVPKLLLAVFFLLILFVVHPASPSQAQGISILCGILALLSVLSIFSKLSVARQRCRGGSLCPAVGTFR